MEGTINVMTVSEAKELLASELKKGCKCPVCGQHAQMYKRTITSAMAKALLIFYGQGEDQVDENGFFHLEKVLKYYADSEATRGDAPKLQLWGLIEKMNSDRPDGSKRNGYYRVTKKGDHFVEGLIEVERSLYIFNDTIYAKSEETITFENALKSNKFKYQEIKITDDENKQ
jgi:hypothetical protein